MGDIRHVRRKFVGNAPRKLDKCGKAPHHSHMSVSSSDLSSSAAPSDDAQRASDPLLGRRLLIVEDDPYIALALEETLSEFGLIIAGLARSVEEAVRLSSGDGVDLALLDVNIGHERIDPVADALAARGCPFIFTTGCGRAGLPEAHLERSMVEKPFYVEEILAALRSELSRADDR
jgi:CheY-like chemotaxis protein